MSSFEIHKQNELRKREIEVKALVAIYEKTENIHIRNKCEARLFNIAFPESLAKEINQETLNDL
jgi:hypothetical protein